MAPGILYALTKIASPLLDIEAFCSWYDTIHIPELFSLPGGPDIAYRYKAIDESRQEWQFMVVYVLDDLAFTCNPVPEGTFRYGHPTLPEGRSILEFISFEGRDYVFVGDEGTALGTTEKGKWAVHAEIGLGDADSQQMKAVLNEERREGVGCSQYRLERIPTAITSQEAVDYDGPKELAIFNIDREEDVDRVVESLGQKLKDIGAQVKFTTWEASSTITK